MFNFRKKKDTITVEFIKTVTLCGNNWVTTYYTNANKRYVSGSLSNQKEEAEKFFDEYIKLRGITHIEEVLKTEIIYK